MSTFVKLTPADLVHLAVTQYGKSGTAVLVGRSPASVTYWLSGRNKPGLSVVFKLCEALGISRDDVEV